MKLYSRICQIVEKDRTTTQLNQVAVPTNLNAFSFLDQKGPRSLNIVTKKVCVKEIMSENQKIKHKIEHAKSNYSLQALAMHNSRVNAHKSILMAHSPSANKLDPLIKKSEKSFFFLNSSNKVSKNASCFN